MQILIAEDEPEILEAFKAKIEAEEGLSVAGAALTVPDALRLMKYVQFDLLLTDLNIGDRSGLELIEACRARTSAKILVISVLGDEKNVVDAIKAGADGYILKDDVFADLALSIERASRGDAPISPSVARHLLKQFQTMQVSSTAWRAEQVGLSDRELQILEGLAQGFSYKEIARSKELSYHTVVDYVKSLYRKLRVNSRSQAVAKAANAGIIELSKMIGDD